MDTIAFYKSVITNSLEAHAELANQMSQSGLETHAVLDDSQGRYALLRVGWQQKKRVRTVILYVRLYDGKIWIEEDWTENGLAADLIAAGIPREIIILAFLHPSKRESVEPVRA
jgi:hypothetical protein